MIDKIIEELEYHKLGWENTDEYNLQRRPFIEAYSKSIEIVKRYENDGWILCSERLPKCEEEVWIQTEKGTRTTANYEDGKMDNEKSAWLWVDIDFDYDEETDTNYIPEGWWEHRHFNPDEVYNCCVDEKVVAWQPLPATYKGE